MLLWQGLPHTQPRWATELTLWGTCGEEAIPATSVPWIEAMSVTISTSRHQIPFEVLGLSNRSIAITTKKLQDLCQNDTHAQVSLQEQSRGVGHCISLHRTDRARPAQHLSWRLLPPQHWEEIMMAWDSSEDSQPIAQAGAERLAGGSGQHRAQAMLVSLQWTVSHLSEQLLVMASVLAASHTTAGALRREAVHTTTHLAFSWRSPARQGQTTFKAGDPPRSLGSHQLFLSAHS